MHPATGFLFFQGNLKAELEGRLVRLRQEAKDVEAEVLRRDLQGEVKRLIRKYSLAPVALAAPGEVIQASDGPGLVWKLPFAGSGVLLNRAAAESGGRRMPGRVVERSVVADGTRSKNCWVEIPVPGELAADPDAQAGWRQDTLHDLTKLLEEANRTADTFQQALASAAETMIKQRADKLHAKGQL
jgi:hypothetical protein